MVERDLEGVKGEGMGEERSGRRAEKGLKYPLRYFAKEFLYERVTKAKTDSRTIFYAIGGTA